MFVKNLKEFLSSEMKMSHIYQPVMIKTLLHKNGSADITSIAKEILQYDPYKAKSQDEYKKQIQYYEDRVFNMVGRVLTEKRNITKRTGSMYTLNNYRELCKDEHDDLISLCDQKIYEKISKCGNQIWKHQESFIARGI